MTKQIDFSRYEHFVDAVTSDASKDFLSLSDRLVELDQKGANIERLMTASVGMSAEAGEFTEIVKKMVFQGKPYNEDNREHLIIELGDVLWYVAQATQALGVSFNDVIETNVKKLEKFSKEIHFDLNSVVATLLFKRDFESLKSFLIDSENIARENVFAYAVLSCSHLYQDGDYKLAESTLERCSALGLDTDTLNKIVMHFEYLESENSQIIEKKLDRKNLSLCNLEHKVVDVSQYKAPQALLDKLETYDHGDRSFYYRHKSSSDVKVLAKTSSKNDRYNTWQPSCCACRQPIFSLVAID